MASSFSGWTVFSGERHLLGLYGRKLNSEEHALMESQVEKPGYVKWDDIEVEQLSSLIGRQFVVGKDVMVARVLLKKGANVPRHQHHNEQITYILEGALEFLIAGERIVVKAGEVLCIPPNMPHEANALEDTVDLDIFNPPRQDWIDRDDAYLRSEK
jgi:quercetin dioxygenase-like cupin family protein